MEMDMVHSCRCCLRCPPDKDLTTPYTHLGETETYADMLKQCFDIHLVLGDEGSRGICSACVGRLRDASDFKLQVQHSQAELQGAWHVKVESEDKSEVADNADDPSMLNVFDEVTIDNPEFSKDEEGAMDVDPLMKSEKDELVNLMSDEFLLPPDSPEFVVNRPTKVYSKNKELITPDVQSQEPNLIIPRIKTEIEEDNSESPKLESEVNTSNILNREMSEVRSGDCAARTKGPLAVACCAVLERHRGHATTHERDKPYTCKDCDQRFKSQSIFIKHIQDTHLSTGPGDIVYNVYSSTSKTNLLVLDHEKSINSFTNFMCAECEYTTVYKKRLIAHLKSHTINKSFHCNNCNCTSRPFKFKCNICDYKFRQKGDLRRHRMVHTGEKPFKCTQCDFRCNQQGSLRRHEVRVHTGPKLFQGSRCDYECRREASRRVYQGMHAKGKLTNVVIAATSAVHQT